MTGTSGARAPTPAGNTASCTDRQVAEKAAAGGTSEVMLGQLAQKQARDEQVKQFGSRMVQDQGKANEELMKRVGTEGIAVSTTVGRDHDADHREVKGRFQQYRELVDHGADDEDKLPLAQQICTMLTVHAQIEEEIFYPTAQSAIKEPDLIDVATVEHVSAKELIAQIEAGDPADERFDAKVKVLGGYTEHHVKEEDGELFPQARKAKLDMAQLGNQLTRRKAELMPEMGMDEEAEQDIPEQL